ncbi:protein tyrosine phosphatase [Arthrobacter citreus]|nr:protein tyrosine phosphatase [Arthrobacter citreus]
MILIKLLFICSKNQWRSPTAEKIFHLYEGHQARSAGTESGARTKLTEGHIGWADIIFVMEKKHLRRIREKFGILLNHKTVVNLDIADDYQYMDEVLIEILQNRVLEQIEK